MVVTVIRRNINLNLVDIFSSSTEALLMCMRKGNACDLVCSCWCNVSSYIVLHLQKSVMHKVDDQNHHMKGGKGSVAHHSRLFLLNWLPFWVMLTSLCVLVKHLCLKEMVSRFDRSWMHESGRALCCTSSLLGNLRISTNDNSILLCRCTLVRFWNAVCQTGSRVVITFWIVDEH